MRKSDFSGDMPASMREAAEQSVEQAHRAVNSYLQFLQSSMPATPWVGAEFNKKLGAYAEQNVANAFAFAQKLIHAKDVQDLVRIQTEFVQAQIQALAEQARELGTAAAKASTSTLRESSGASS